MRFSAAVRAIMKQNLNAFYASGDPDAIYQFLSAELLECEPKDLLLLHNLLKRDIAKKEDATEDKLIALTKRFFSGLRDVLNGILAERIGKYKEDKDFLPLGEIFAHALQTDPKILHEVGQLVYHDYYGPEVIERAQKSSIYKYHDEISNHFLKTNEQTQSNEVNVDADTLDGHLDKTPYAIAEIRMLHLIDVVSCYLEANPENLQ